MSAVFCGQALVSTESATSGQSATSQCLSALPGRLGRGKFVPDGLGWYSAKETYNLIDPTDRSHPIEPTSFQYDCREEKIHH